MESHAKIIILGKNQSVAGLLYAGKLILHTKAPSLILFPPVHLLFFSFLFLFLTDRI